MRKGRQKGTGGEEPTGWPVLSESWSVPHSGPSNGSCHTKSQESQYIESAPRDRLENCVTCPTAGKYESDVTHDDRSIDLSRVRVGCAVHGDTVGASSNSVKSHSPHHVFSNDSERGTRGGDATKGATREFSGIAV